MKSHMEKKKNEKAWKKNMKNKIKELEMMMSGLGPSQDNSSQDEEEKKYEKKQYKSALKT